MYRLIFIFTGIIMLWVVRVQADPETDVPLMSEDIQKAELYLRYRLAISVHEYDQALEECIVHRLGEVPVIEQEELDKLGFTPKEFYLALTIMKIENSTKCAKGELNQAGFDLARYAEFLKVNNIKDAQIDYTVTENVFDVDGSELVIDPSRSDFGAYIQIVIAPPWTDHLLIEAQFQALSHKKKAYIRQKVGNAIFSPSDVIQFNELFAYE